ncbi:gamma interferon inducible lysosomal thiol reductase (GILT) protein, partial [Toxoplasma gondii RUB]
HGQSECYLNKVE